MLYLVRISGEIVLKSRRTRARFERRLLRNLADMLRRKGFEDFKIEREDARIFVEGPSEMEDVISRVFGIHSLSPATRVEFESLEELASKAEAHFKKLVEGKKFAVRARRAGEHSFTSMDVARVVGARLLPYSAGVDLARPEVEVYIEVRGEKAYFFDRVIRGPGGLPIGVNGRALSLFSGGFDSPVASWMAWKRGVQLEFLHFNLGGAEQVYRAFRVLKKLFEEWCSGYRPRLYVVDFRRVVLELRKKVREDLRQVVLRRMMYRAAEVLARKVGADAIVTGESLGQVSTQTLKNIVVAEEAISATVLRPLLGFDKQEIMDLARRIGTYEESAKLEEYCAIAQGPVATRARLEDVKHEEERLPSDLLERALSTIQEVDVASTEPEDLLPRDTPAIDFVPEEAIVVDVRRREEYEEWHYPGALHLDEVDLESLPKDKVIVLYCSSGGLSLALAEELRELGLRAYSIKGGIEKLRTVCRPS